jgi:MFS family permease
MTSYKLYLSWIVSTAFFFYQYMLRALPSIMSQEIFEIFKITAEEFSSLGSIYLMTYGILQIPIGFLLDRLNLTKIALGAILFSIAGALIFGISKDFYMMQISRFILAIGSAAALGITLKIISSSSEGMTRSILSGITLTVGVLGPILGGKIVAFILQSNDWRIAMIIIGLSGFILFIMSCIFIQNVNYNTVVNGFKNIFPQIRYGFSSSILTYAIIAGGIYAPVCVFGDLWGVRFLSVKFNMSDDNAISVSLSIYWGLAIGSLILPYISEKINNLHRVTVISVLINAVLFCIILFSDNLSLDILYILMILIGFFCGAEMICFNAAWRIVPQHCTAITVGVINSISLIFNAILLHCVGLLIDMMWNGDISYEGIRVYSENNYIIGMSLIPLALFLSFGIGLVLLRQSKYKQLP